MMVRFMTIERDLGLLSGLQCKAAASADHVNLGFQAQPDYPLHFRDEVRVNVHELTVLLC